jgi:hypothetical protein
LEGPPSGDATDEELEQREEMREKFRIVRTVLEQGGQFSGINRKVQLKPVKWAAPATPATAAAVQVGDGVSVGAVSSTGSDHADGEGNGNNNNNSSSSSAGGGIKEEVVLNGLEAAAQQAVGGEAGGIQQQQQQQKQITGGAASGKDEGPVLEEALMILKYGGVLTHAGRQQAEDLGRIFRLVMYPRWDTGYYVAANVC